MTATDELRKLLDERGVEYEQADGWWTSWETEGVYSYGGVVYCEDLGSGLEIRWHTITPEQAIDATLGNGECELTLDGTDGNFGCSECLENIPPLANFCPNCGRRVKQ